MPHDMGWTGSLTISGGWNFFRMIMIEDRHHSKTKLFREKKKGVPMTSPKLPDPEKQTEMPTAGPKSSSAKSGGPKSAPRKKDAAAPEHDGDTIDFPIVGIGASAGGLEALERFFANLPSQIDIAFIVIQHMSPRHKSSMAHLLARKTSFRVVELQADQPVEPNCVYVNPPNKFVTLERGVLRLSEPLRSAKGIQLSIDHFFNSLAEDRQERAVCVILSGTASDGSLGLKAVKAAGGLVFAQSPEDAKYAGMPAAAIATQMVDFVLPVDQMPSKIIDVITHPYVRLAEGLSENGDDENRHLNQVFSLLRQKTKHDFSNYKPTTLNRRIARRMAVHQVRRLSDYVRVLKADAAEPARLMKDMLIGVTRFFRDPKAFVALQKQVLIPLVKRKKAADDIRVWVPGCSTGEEVYTIAILIAETMDQLDIYGKVQMFASDIDAEAIHIARCGEYLKNIAGEISPKRIDRFFSPTDTGFKIKKQIRDMIVFSIHNLIGDPPFSRMDLISCRNLLIYLKQDLQRKVIPALHYALNPDGVLFLGPSESIGDMTDLFVPVSVKYRIFRRQETLPRDSRSFHRMPAPGLQTVLLPDDDTGTAPEMDIFRMTERIVLDEFAPPSALIDHNFEILHFIGETDRYLKTPRGIASFNILEMAREGLFHALRHALTQAVKTGEQIICRDLQVKYLKETVAVDITIRPVAEKIPGKDLYIVMFLEKDPVVEEREPDAPEAASGDPTVQRLQDELQSARRYLQSVVGDLEASNEELKATNEELQSVNEELQSSNEELETSREELQSTNEELVTVNSELQEKIDELTKSNNDINNLLESTEIASLFLNLDLCVRRFTPAVTRIINLRPMDIGRPITDITTRLAGTDLFQPAREVIRKLDRKTIEVQDKDGRWYEMRILPYRTTENVIDGVTIAFIEITKVRQAEMLKRMTALFEKSSDAIAIQDFDGNIIEWNRKAAQCYGWAREEALKMNIREITPEALWDEYGQVVQMLRRGNPVRPFRTQRLTKDGRPLDVWVMVTLLMDENGKPFEFATIERDVGDVS